VGPTSAQAPVRLTPQRAAVLDVVRASRDHPTAREIFARVGTVRPGIGFATVYRALGLLAAHGLVRELNLGDGASVRYDGNTRPHQHVVCTDCGSFADVSVELPSTIADAVSTATGYAVKGYDVRFQGRCPNCGPAAAPPGR
jgi:Fe2+ or Zn2+ uptake regulation protein